MKQKQTIKANRQTPMGLHKAAASPQASAAQGFKSQTGAISSDKPPKTSRVLFSPRIFLQLQGTNRVKSS